MPYDLPIRASDGNFYGISQVNGAPNAMVYRISPNGDFKILVTYPNSGHSTTGAYGESLLQASNGKLYGEAAFGGQHHGGSIFEFSLGGKLKTLYEFGDASFGLPTKLLEATDGDLYGVAKGSLGLSSLFRITKDGKFERLHYLNAAKIGDCPCSLTLGSDGKIYGNTAYGSPAGNGSLFSWDLGNAVTKPIVDGVYPAGAAPGATVTVFGKNLLGPSAVSFNGFAAATFQSMSKQFISAIVPANARSGKVTVTTMNGTATSHRSFTVQ